jgi:ABC-type proline/glycine betaine transport system substrate-binding protein
MPARRMTLPELEKAWGSIEAANERPLSNSEKEMLARQIHRLNDDAWMMWRLWSPSFNKQAKLLAEVAKRTRAARYALGALADGDWDPQWSTIRSLVNELYSLRVKNGKADRTDVAHQAVGAEIKALYETLGEVVAAARLASKQRAEAAEKYGVARGHDRTIDYFLENLAELWIANTNTKLDAWIDKDTRTYHGQFWNFVMASIVVVREFMGQKANNGAIHSRIDRLNRQSKRGRFRQLR